MHLVTLVQEAEQRVSELQAQVGSEGPGERDVSDRERQLKAWEWRLRLFQRMQTGFEHASKACTLFLCRHSVWAELMASTLGSIAHGSVCLCKHNTSVFLL